MVRFWTHCILFSESPELADLMLAQWNKIVANNPSFAFLHDPEEDIYTLEDGIAVSYQGKNITDSVSL